MRPAISCLLLQIALAFVTYTSAAAADNPDPIVIKPKYSDRAGVDAKSPTNMTELRALLNEALGSNAVDESTYYVVHRAEYLLDDDSLHDKGWFIYFAPWHKRRPLGIDWLNDPLSGRNFKAKRIYGASEFRLVPLIRMPFLDFSKVNDAIRGNFEKQVVDQITSKPDLGYIDAIQSLATPKGQAPDKNKIFNQLKGLFLNRFGIQLTSTDYDNAVVEAENALETKHFVPHEKDSSISIGNLNDDAGKIQFSTEKNLTPTDARFVKILSAWLVRETLEAYFQNQLDAISTLNTEVLVGNGKSTSAISPEIIGSTLIYFPQSFPSKRPNYRVTVTSRDAQPFADFKDLLALALGQGGGITLQADLTLDLFSPMIAFETSVANERVGVSILPSDVLLEAIPADQNNDKTNNTNQKTVIGSVKLQDEKKYHYGFGFALPVKSFDDVQFDSTNGIITSKKVQKQNLFALLQYYPWATDTTGLHLRLLPSIVAGLPITGKPLNQQIYGGSIGLWKLEGFVGLLVHRNLVPAPGAISNTVPDPTKTSNSLQPKWGARLTFGMVIPVSTVKSLISSNKSSPDTKSSKSTTGNSNANSPKSSSAPSSNQ